MTKLLTDMTPKDYSDFADATTVDTGWIILNSEADGFTYAGQVLHRVTLAIGFDNCGYIDDFAEVEIVLWCDHIWLADNEVLGDTSLAHVLHSVINYCDNHNEFKAMS